MLSNAMKTNRRHSERVPLSCTVNLTQVEQISVKEQSPQIVAYTDNISDTGLFVYTHTHKPQIGTVYKCCVNGLLKSPPSRLIEVVRVDNHGVGLRFKD